MANILCAVCGLVSLCRMWSGTAELQWLEHLWNHEKMFEIGVVRANECLS